MAVAALAPASLCRTMPHHHPHILRSACLPVRHPHRDLRIAAGEATPEQLTAPYRSCRDPLAGFRNFRSEANVYVMNAYGAVFTPGAPVVAAKGGLLQIRRFGFDENEFYARGTHRFRLSDIEKTTANSRATPWSPTPSKTSPSRPVFATFRRPNLRRSMTASRSSSASYTKSPAAKSSLKPSAPAAWTPRWQSATRTSSCTRSAGRYPVTLTATVSLSVQVGEVDASPASGFTATGTVAVVLQSEYGARTRMEYTARVDYEIQLLADGSVTVAATWDGNTYYIEYFVLGDDDASPDRGEIRLTGSHTPTFNFSGTYADEDFDFDTFDLDMGADSRVGVNGDGAYTDTTFTGHISLDYTTNLSADPEGDSCASLTVTYDFQILTSSPIPASE
ncbi:MAG: hypothetical protein QF719_04645 [Chloroflexota bacterium]|nr:hypothetical protein [Chloroflexota bacterium]